MWVFQVSPDILDELYQHSAAHFKKVTLRLEGLPHDAPPRPTYVPLISAAYGTVEVGPQLSAYTSSIDKLFSMICLAYPFPPGSSSRCRPDGTRFILTVTNDELLRWFNPGRDNPQPMSLRVADASRSWHEENILVAKMTDTTPRRPELFLTHPFSIFPEGWVRLTDLPMDHPFFGHFVPRHPSSFMTFRLATHEEALAGIH